MSVSKTPNQYLADYLRRRLHYLEQCNVEINKKLSANGGDLCRKIDAGEYGKNDSAVGQIIFHLEYVVGNTFRYTMLIGVCSFLEEAMKAIAQRLLPDYDAKIEAHKRVNWLRKHIRVLSTSAALDTPIQSDLDKFYALITLRNCVVHAWGKVAEAKHPKAVIAAAKQIETAEISKDGFLVLGDQVVPDAINAAENIAESFLIAKLQASMT